MRRWQRRSGELLFRHPLLSLERQLLVAGPDEQREALVLAAPDWVNVIPLLGDGRVVMVRQWRFGIAAPTLEIPGGVVDPGEAAADAAARELREETGYRATAWRRLGEVTPNPAILANRCATFLATGLEAGEPLPASLDEELAVELVPLAEVPQRVARGEIHHALVVAAFYLLGASGEPADEPAEGRDG
ncbi:MAG TPA: NUDIX hydrolase [Thermoanaerobaculia bacterium]|nr:NUDIX hydrolase [Thermoanaerobaculia bacterium]